MKWSDKLTYKVALVTGASSGIGRACAISLGSQGFKLILVARRAEKLAALQDELKTHTECFCIAEDIRNHSRIEELIGQLPNQFSQIDVLINNAGLALGLDTAQNASWSDWEDMININCSGLAFMTHLLTPKMVERNCGHIINIGSIAGTYPYYGGNVYGATKAFVEQLTLNLKADLLGTKVRVSNIEPGMVSNSEFSLVRFGHDQVKANAVYKGIEALKPEDIANCILWILDQPNHVNINRVELMPVSQAPSRTAFHKEVDSSS